MSIGFNGPNMAKILKLMNREDIVLMKAEDDGDTVTLMFESNEDSKTIADFGKCCVRRMIYLWLLRSVVHVGVKCC